MGILRKLFGSFGSHQEPPDNSAFLKELQVGGLYSVYNGDESKTFGIVKVLVLEPMAVHICVYADTFPTRPTEVDPANLSMGELNFDDVDDDTLDDEAFGEKLESQPFGIGHMPISPRDFVLGWQPVLLVESPVTEEELEGYNYWKEAGGGIWGGL
jgi:hypothetical protein